MIATHDDLIAATETRVVALRNRGVSTIIKRDAIAPALPAKPPTTAPPTVAAVRPLPLPIVLPSTPPMIAPSTAPPPELPARYSICSMPRIVPHS